MLIPIFALWNITFNFVSLSFRAFSAIFRPVISLTTLIICGSSLNSIILEDNIVKILLLSFRLKIVSKFSHFRFFKRDSTNVARSNKLFHRLISEVDFPIASAREYPNNAVKVSFALIITPSFRRVIMTASGLVLKINSNRSLASTFSEFNFWLTIITIP